MSTSDAVTDTVNETTKVEEVTEDGATTEITTTTTTTTTTITSTGDKVEETTKVEETKTEGADVKIDTNEIKTVIEEVKTEKVDQEKPTSVEVKTEIVEEVKTENIVQEKPTIVEEVETEVVEEVKPEEVVEATVITQEIKEVTAAEVTEEEAKQAEEPQEISGGLLYKQRNTVLFNWSSKYFSFGSKDKSYELEQLSVYHDRTIKSGVGKPVNAAESTEAQTTSTAEEIKAEETSFKPLYATIAHATVTGEGLLFYYRSDANQKPQGIISLAEVVSVEADKSLGKSHAFTIKATNREYHLHANNEPELNRWIQTIKNKVEKAKEVFKEIQAKDEYQKCYKLLLEKKAFTKGKSSEADVISSDEDAEPKEPKRRATFPFLAFSKQEATTSDASKAEAKETAEATTSTSAEAAEKVESPKKTTGGTFFSFLRPKPPSNDDAKDDAANVKEKTTEEKEIVEAETSNAAEVTDQKEEEQKKEEQKKEEEKTSFLERLTRVIKPSTKEEATVTTAATTTEVTEEQKKETTEETTVKTEETTTDTAEVDAKEAEAKEVEAKETEGEQKKESNIRRRFTFQMPKFGVGTKTEVKAAETKVEETKQIAEETETKVEEAKVEETETSKVEEIKVEEAAENVVSTSDKDKVEELKTDGGIDIKRSQSVFKRISGKLLPRKQTSQDGSGDIAHGKEPSEAVTSGPETTPLETATNATETTEVEKVETEFEKEIKQKKAAAAKHGSIKKESRYLKQFQPCEFIFSKEEKIIYYYHSNEKSAKTINISRDVKVKKNEGKQFDINTPSRTYRLEANTSEECDEWVTVLSGFIDSIPADPVVPPKEVEETKGETSTQVTESAVAKEAAELYETAAQGVTTTTTVESEKKETEVQAASSSEEKSEIKTETKTEISEIIVEETTKSS